MKITAQEEYGLRILIRIAACRTADGMSIPQLSEAEGITPHYVAKLTRVLRMEGFINSTPGNKGGYILAKPAKEISYTKRIESPRWHYVQQRVLRKPCGRIEPLYQFGRLFRPFSLENGSVHGG